MQPYGFKSQVNISEAATKDAKLLRKRGFQRFDERGRVRVKLNQIVRDSFDLQIDYDEEDLIAIA